MSAVQSRAERSGGKRSTSSHLGSRLRAVLVSPRTGFRSAMRPEAASTISSSPTSAVMVLLGGVTTMALWLKVTGLVQLAERSASETSWDTVLPALGLGGLLGVIAYLLWTRFAVGLTGATNRRSGTDRLRVAWAFSDFPLAVYAVLMVPLDLLIVGPEVFSTDRPDGTFAMVWSALSVALLLSVTAWSIFLFVRGLEAATRPGSGVVVRLAATAGVAVWLFYVLLLIKELFE